jgi:hypothetical protein
MLQSVALNHDITQSLLRPQPQKQSSLNSKCSRDSGLHLVDAVAVKVHFVRDRHAIDTCLRVVPYRRKITVVLHDHRQVTRGSHAAMHKNQVVLRENRRVFSRCQRIRETRTRIAAQEELDAVRHAIARVSVLLRNCLLSLSVRVPAALPGAIRAAFARAAEPLIVPAAR